MEPEMLALLNKTIALMENLGFLYVVNTGLKLDLWDELSEEKGLDELLGKHPSWDRITLDHWLEQAYCLDLLTKNNSKYRITKLGKAVEAYRFDGLESMYDEFIACWSPSFAKLPELITRQTEKATLDSQMEDELISRASLASEPFVWPFLKTKCEREKWSRLLDIGCGEGSYLLKLIKLNEKLEGVGVEINPVVAQRAAEKASAYSNRVKIACGDALQLDKSLGQFDVILLNNNIYYFNHEQRIALLTRLKEFLTAKGQIGILTALRDSGYEARLFRTHIPQNLMSFFLSCHQGFQGLPTEQEIRELLTSCGLTNIQGHAMALRTSYYFFATR